jgi:three-Cys-motif partner protein
MPDEKFVEARRQTQHKLELMERYWGAWCTILARTAGRYPFCPTRLWLVDTHAGSGEHASATDPDGKIEGTPALAALAARDTQRRFPGVEVRVRATDKSKSVAQELLAAMRPYRGVPPLGVDIKVGNVDWVKAAPWVAAEVADETHPHGGRPVGEERHDHRSLWFIDPYGVESIEHDVIDKLPSGSEVIINLDLMGLLRHAGRAHAGEVAIQGLLARVYGGDGWDAPSRLAHPHQPLADALASSFPRWRYRNAYLLRASGSQDRAMVHLTDSKTAVEAFARAVESALKAGTVIAGRTLTTIERDKAAVQLFERFRGLTMTTRQMYAVVTRYSLGQLRPICNTAEKNRYGRWDDKTGTMKWLAERAPELAPLTLDL